jgi:hypothetical protein
MRPSSDEELDPEAAKVFNKVRRIMAISTLLTGIAIAAVLGVIGYRIFKSGDVPRVAATSDVVASLPAGARVVSTAVTPERIAVTIETGGETEVLLYDTITLQPRGRLKLSVGK